MGFGGFKGGLGSLGCFRGFRVFLGFQSGNGSVEVHDSLLAWVPGFGFSISRNVALRNSESPKATRSPGLKPLCTPKFPSPEHPQP